MRKTLLSLLGMFMLAMTTWADLPFRLYRYDGFKTHKIDSQSIVFLGNSITNMHEWWEAFGNSHIVNRGVNGAETPIMLQHLEAVLVGHPSKIFFMMGTNDLGTSGMNNPAFVAKSVRTALIRCKKESPETKVYFQSILPCTTNGIKNVSHIPMANDSIKRLCNEYGATYIDLYDDLKGIATKAISYDGTHLTMAGYRIWCNKIAQYVGSSCVYPSSATDNNNGLSGINGMRNTYFAALPITSKDIIMIGDDGNDWHELLNSDHVKQRGGSWGYTQNDLGTIKSMLPNIFKGRSDNEAPKMVCLFLGYPEIAGSTALSTIETNYKAVLNQIRSYCPSTTIKIMAVIPSPTSSVNTSRTVPFNNTLKAIADTMSNVDFVEGSYTELAENNALKTAYAYQSRLSGVGHAKLSEVVAAAIGEDTGITATTEAQAAERIATFNARNSLLTAITTAQSLPIGDKVGQFTATNAKSVIDGIEEGYALLAKTGVSDSEYTEKGTNYTSLVNAVLPKINQPLASTQETEYWYQLYTPLRDNRYVTSNGIGEKIAGGDASSYAKSMWKFVSRTDGSFDIINRADNSYISPSATYNTGLATSSTQPTAGWSLSYANTPGYFIISSGSVQFNQSTSANTGRPIFNWGSGTNRDDAGCQYAIIEAPELVEPFVEGDINIARSTGTLNSTTYGKVWTSTSTDPQLTLTTNANNIWTNDDGETLNIYNGSAGTSTTYTLSVPNGYVITGLRFDMKNVTNSNLTIKLGDYSKVTSNEEQHFEVINLNDQTITFTVSGEKSKGFAAKNFAVSIKNTTLPGENEVLVSTSTGTRNSTSFSKQWTSTQTTPQIVLSTTANNMYYEGTNLTLYNGSKTDITTYTLSVPDGYVITAYRFTMVNVSGSTSAMVVAAGDYSLTSSSSEQAFAVNNLQDQSVTFTVAGDKSKGIVAKNFIVAYKKKGTIHITDAGYGTYFTSQAYTMPIGVTGYIITDRLENTLKAEPIYTEGTLVPEKTALIVKGEAGDYSYVPVASLEVTPSNNMLHGSDVAETTHVDGTNVKYYKFSYNLSGENLGFYWANEAGTAFTNAANKAYLALDFSTQQSQIRGFSLADLFGGVTSINQAFYDGIGNQSIYDLNGRYVNSLKDAAKGIYIVNGKKVVIK